MISSEKLAEGEVGGQKGSEVRPQGGQVYNSKALQRLAGETICCVSRFCTNMDLAS